MVVVLLAEKKVPQWSYMRHQCNGIDTIRLGQVVQTDKTGQVLMTKEVTREFRILINRSDLLCQNGWMQCVLNVV